MPTTPSKSQIEALDAYWRAANYLTVGQIYLLDNPLLREPLRPEHIKPRLLGHWGTSPGLSLIYVHLNRLIREVDANVIYLAGPGHGGPAILANAYLEGTYSDHVAPDGRVMEVLSEHSCEGWLEGYLLTGRHGLFATYEAFAMVSASMTVQHTKWLAESIRLPWRRPIASLNVLLTSTCWRNDHNGFSHQGPGLIDTMLSKKGSVSRIYLP